jgi:hypothetical protein
MNTVNNGSTPVLSLVNRLWEAMDATAIMQRPINRNGRNAFAGALERIRASLRACIVELMAIVDRMAWISRMMLRSDLARLDRKGSANCRVCRAEVGSPCLKLRLLFCGPDLWETRARREETCGSAIMRMLLLL